ncbi:MAG: zinc-ribbon domain-containing protein [Geobacter sp.]|nr:zinc-ribbon domain-containing protein [Geobacter sp.]
MSTVRVSCPHCSFSRDLTADKIPDRPVRVTCPKCKEAFEFRKPSALAPEAGSRPTPSILPPPAPPSQSPPPLSGVGLSGSTPQPTPKKPEMASPKRVPPPTPPRPSTSGGLGGTNRRLILLSGFLLVVASGAGVYKYGNPLSLLKSGGSEGRQVITIPPPSGDLPAGLPQGAGPGGASTPSTGTGLTPTIEIGPASGVAPSGSSFRETDLSIFIYAVNAPGTIRVNGQEFEVIKSVPDMQYNISVFGKNFQTGVNAIDFDVTPRPGEEKKLSPEIQMKVSQGGRVLGEWRLSDKDGWPRSVIVNIPEGKSP